MGTWIKWGYVLCDLSFYLGENFLSFAVRIVVIYYNFPYPFFTPYWGFLCGSGWGGGG